MKILAIVCNLVYLGFTAMVMLTDGPPTRPLYIVFGALIVLIPILNVVVLWQSGAAWAARWKIFAIGGNAVLLGSVVWSLVDQSSHPREEGYITYVLLSVLTPILSAVVIRPCWPGSTAPP